MTLHASVGVVNQGLPLKVTLETAPKARNVDRLTKRPRRAVTARVVTTCISCFTIRVLPERPQTYFSVHKKVCRQFEDSDSKLHTVEQPKGEQQAIAGTA